MVDEDSFEIIEEIDSKDPKIKELEQRFEEIEEENVVFSRRVWFLFNELLDASYVLAKIEKVIGAEKFKQIYDDYNFDKSTLTKIKDVVKTNYNGYKFNVEQENLVYNSTLLNYFLFHFINYKGKIPKFAVLEGTCISPTQRASGGDSGCRRRHSAGIREGLVLAGPQYSHCICSRYG